MKRENRIIAVFLLIGCLFSCITVAPAYASSLSEEDQIKIVVSQFFENYYYGIENTSEGYSASAASLKNLLVETDSTLQYLTYYKWQKAFLDEFELNYQNCAFDIAYTQVVVQEDTATVDLNFSMTYNYSFSPEIESAVYDILYTFTLVKENNEWKVSGIETDSNEYACFLEELSTYVQADSDELMLSECEETQLRMPSDENAMEQFLIHKIADIGVIKQQAMDSVTNSAQFAETSIDRSGTGDITTYSNVYAYDASNGVEYATLYAEAPEDDRLFYTATGNDCTNFVSQCVWAAYGGFTTYVGSLENIADQKRMVKKVWHGGAMGGGGSIAWEGVDEFYAYVTGAKTYGPNGTGINNGEPWNLYPNYSGSVPVGTVLQFRKVEDEEEIEDYQTMEYEHSVYVTEILSPPVPDSTYGYLRLVLVSYHSNDHENQSLLEVIAWFGGSACYMRGISFSSASFES